MNSRTNLYKVTDKKQNMQAGISCTRPRVLYSNTACSVSQIVYFKITIQKYYYIIDSRQVLTSSR